MYNKCCDVGEMNFPSLEKFVWNQYLNLYTRIEENMRNLILKCIKMGLW